MSGTMYRRVTLPLPRPLPLTLTPAPTLTLTLTLTLTPNPNPNVYRREDLAGMMDKMNEMMPGQG